MKKIIFFLFFIIMVALSLFGWWQYVNLPVNPQDKTEQIFVIPQGAGANQIGKALLKQGFIKNGWAFRLMTIKLGIQNKIQAGDYYLAPSMTLTEICQTFTHGTLDLWITIPEGLRKEEIALIINKAFQKAGVEFDSAEFVNLAKDQEGYLFPDTYLVPKKSSPQNVLDILINTFEQKYATLNNQSNLKRDEVVILASLLEREVKTDEDRALVAGIMEKRLKAGMPLQLDATIQYGKANLTCNLQLVTCDDWWPKVVNEDLKTASPYNTYLNKDLPPTPICNPGMASLQAVMNPKTSDYWYYLSDNKGKLHYAKTLEEQESNIERYLNN